MPITTGAVTARTWRVLDTLPPNFKELFERNLKRHAFQPIDPEKGQIQAHGWVNARQMLDSRLTLEKVLFRNLIVLALRVDRLAINQKLFRATLAQEIGRVLKEKGRPRLSREEKLVVEDKVKTDLLKRTQPNTAVYEMAWQLESGVVWFGSTSQRLNQVFADLFSETFQVSLEPQFPFLRARDWAERQNLGTELLELLPTPFSPEAPVEVIEATPSEEE